ncbi:MAG: hypothetical protein JNJ73_11835 [Hyphomonadaceae bacterium]|nr:hypothetical protein [Hyphomonadaceae bacterium]
MLKSERLTGYRLALAAAAAGALAFAAACANPERTAAPPGPSFGQAGAESSRAPVPPAWGRG